MRFLATPVGTTLRYALSAAVLGWLAWGVEWARFAELFAVDARLLISAMLVAGLAYPSQAWRWQLLLRTQGIFPPTRWVHGVFWIGHFFNSFLPGGIAGDAVRFAWLWKMAPDRNAGSAASLIADRVLGLGSLCVLAALGLGGHLLLAGVNPGLATLFAGSAAAVVVMFALGWAASHTRWWMGLVSRFVGARRGEALRTTADALVGAPRTLMAAAAISVVVWLLDFVSLWLLARGIGLEAGLLELSVAAAAAYAAAALPISIGGHGVREGTLVAVLALLGIGAAQPGEIALLALAFWAVSVGWSLFGGVVYLISLATGWPLAAGVARATVVPERV